MRAVGAWPSATKIKRFGRCARTAQRPMTFANRLGSPVVEAGEALEAGGLRPIGPFVAQALGLARIAHALREAEDIELIAAVENRPRWRRQRAATMREVGE